MMLGIEKNCTLIHRYVFLTRGARIGKHIIQGLLRLYRGDIFWFNKNQDFIYGINR
jgi:hypothetical protein